MPHDDVAATLAEVAGALPGGGEERPGQTSMAKAVAHAIDVGRHLVVQAGTGTGKSLAYLVPAIASGRTVVVATATKALQDQLATKDLPFLAAQLGEQRPFTFAVLKGRSNYLCLQKAAEITGRSLLMRSSGPADGAIAETLPDTATDLRVESDAEPASDADTGSRAAPAWANPDGLVDEVRRIIAWADEASKDPAATGDRAELDFEPQSRAWAMLSVSARECPGAYRCPSGPQCFAERARGRAAEAEVVVVNTHLYATHVKSKGTVLPDHQVVILDEAHAVEDIMTAGLGVELAPGRLRALAQVARGLVAADDAGLVDGIAESADHFDELLQPLAGRRVLAARKPGADPISDELAQMVVVARGRVAAVLGALGRGPTDDDAAAPGDQRAALTQRAVLAAGHLADDLDAVIRIDDDQVAWVEASGPGSRVRTLRLAPIDIGPVLAELLWPEVTAVLTSATVPPLLERHLGLPASDTDRLDVGSPFPFDRNALLYCAAHLPDPRRPGADNLLHVELLDLIRAAGGRTLALFTSWRAMHAAAEVLIPVLPFRVLTQQDLPKARLIEAFAAVESACLFATMSFWQGVDVPGPTLSLVAVDRLPFARPDDPLIDARRRRAGDNAFRLVDLPRAATLLAQGAGRLIRSSTDTGVVAVLDSRLATASYGRVLRGALAPMRFTTDKAEAVEFLQAIDRRGATVQ